MGTQWKRKTAFRKSARKLYVIHQGAPFRRLQKAITGYALECHVALLRQAGGMKPQEEGHRAEKKVVASRQIHGSRELRQPWGVGGTDSAKAPISGVPKEGADPLPASEVAVVETPFVVPGVWQRIGVES